jgi:hypothetical protein
MSFLYPSFLWALTALSIPIIIHLLISERLSAFISQATAFYASAGGHHREAQVEALPDSCLALLFVTFSRFIFAQPIIPASEQFSTNRNISHLPR